MKHLVMMLFVPVGLCACVAPSPFNANIAPALTDKGSDTEGMATIYVIRDIPKAGTSYDALVQIDHTPKGRLKRGSYLRINVQPGPHEVRIAWPIWMMGDAKGIALNGLFKANRTYYFLMDQENTWGNRNMTIVATTTIDQIGPAAALPRLHIYANF